MKVVNEKGKLFGIINPVDLLIVIALVLVVFAVGYKFLAKPVASVVAPKSGMEVTLRVRGAMPTLVEQMNTAAKPGTKLVAGNDYIDDAKIKSVSLEPYAFTVQNAAGVTVKTVDPVKQDIIIVIESSASPNDPVIKIGNQEIRAGRGYIFKTNTVEVNANIDSVKFNG